MSAALIAAAAVLLTPQTAPHPSTLEPYSAPVIRPFEPADDFGRELVQGEAVVAAGRPVLAAPVTVEAWSRAHEAPPGELQLAYERGVASAELRADQTAGPLDGAWRVVDAEGRVLFDLVLMDAGAGRAEGGWRTPREHGAAVAEDGVLQLENGGGTIALERAGAGWRGRLTADGRTQAVTLSRPDRA